MVSASHYALIDVQVPIAAFIVLHVARGTSRVARRMSHVACYKLACCTSHMYHYSTVMPIWQCNGMHYHCNTVQVPVGTQHAYHPNGIAARGSFDVAIGASSLSSVQVPE